MPKYFNTLFGPVLYNDNGQTVEGLGWIESEETEQIKAALKREELLEVDSDGNFIYDGNTKAKKASLSPKKSDKLEG